MILQSFGGDSWRLSARTGPRAFTGKRSSFAVCGSALPPSNRLGRTVVAPPTTAVRLLRRSDRLHKTLVYCHSNKKCLHPADSVMMSTAVYETQQ